MRMNLAVQLGTILVAASLITVYQRRERAAGPAAINSSVVLAAIAAANPAAWRATT